MSHAVDAKRRRLSTVSKDLKTSLSRGPTTIRNATHLHGLCAGLKQGDVLIDGDSGDYLGVLNDGATIRVKGNAGRYLADNMTRGLVMVDGDAGFGAGAYCYGGTITISGDAGDFTAVMNKGATILVRGDVGDDVATYMLAGEVIILGNAGKNLGNFLIRGEIYIAGEWESLGHNTRLEDLTPEDVAKLQGIFDEHDMDKDPSAFQKITRLSEKPFYKSKQATQTEDAMLAIPSVG